MLLKGFEMLLKGFKFILFWCVGVIFIQQSASGKIMHYAFLSTCPHIHHNFEL